VVSRFAARVVTGPVAFLLGAVIDVLAYAVASARGRLGRSRRG
jgi:type IV secretory pathway VirB2 component (pilin)